MNLLKALFLVKEAIDSKILGSVVGAYVNVYGYQEPEEFCEIVSDRLRAHGIEVISMEDLSVIDEEEISTLNNYEQECVSTLSKENIPIVCGEFFTYESTRNQH